MSAVLIKVGIDLSSMLSKIVRDECCTNRSRCRSNRASNTVYKFKMNKQLTLLGYSFDDGVFTLELIALGAHDGSP